MNHEGTKNTKEHKGGSFRTLRTLCLCGLLAVAVYLNSLPNDFVIDDRPVIVGNVFLRRPDGLRKIFTTDVWAFFGQERGSQYYRPLMHSASYAGWRLFGANPAGYRAVNIALHACVSLLLFFWLRRLGSGESVAAAAALLFAVHPVHVEAVAWISALPDLQCAFFFLLGFLLHLAGERARGRRRRLADAGVGACVLLGLLAKETAIALPVMLAVYEVFKRREVPSSKSQVPRPRVWRWAWIAGAMAVYLAMRWNAVGRLLPAPGGPRLSPVQSAAGWLALLDEYAARVVFPIHLRTFHQLSYETPVFGLETLGGLVVGIALVALAAWLWRRGRIECLGVLLFLIALLPTFPGSYYEHALVMGERYLYLPSVGFCWLLAAAIMSARRYKGAWPWCLGVLVVLTGLYAARTVTFNRAWRDEVGFYERILKMEGEAPRIRPLLVDALVRRGRPDRALEHAEALVRLKPRDPGAHNAVGFVYWALGRPEKAAPEYRRAAEYARQRGQPELAARALNNLAVLYSQAGRMDLALPLWEDSVRLDADFVDGHVNLGSALYTVGRMEGAEQHLRAAIRLDPAAAPAWSALGLVLAARQEFDAARAAFARALAIEPGDAETLARDGQMELEAGNVAAARQLLGRAAARDPSNARAQAGLARLPGGDAQTGVTLPGNKKAASRSVYRFPPDRFTGRLAAHCPKPVSTVPLPRFPDNGAKVTLLLGTGGCRRVAEPY